MPSSTATQVLAVGITAARSSTITVAQGEVAHIVAFVGAGVTDAHDWPVMHVYHLTPGADRKASCSDERGRSFDVTLSPNRTNATLTAPGEYQIDRPAYTGTPIGFAVDQ